jgi:hypothetical protein
MCLLEDEASAAAVIGAIIWTPTWTNNCLGRLFSLSVVDTPFDHVFSDQLATFLPHKLALIPFHYFSFPLRRNITS